MSLERQQVAAVLAALHRAGMAVNPKNQSAGEVTPHVDSTRASGRFARRRSSSIANFDFGPSKFDLLPSKRRPRLPQRVRKQNKALPQTAFIIIASCAWVGVVMALSVKIGWNLAWAAFAGPVIIMLGVAIREGTADDGQNSNPLVPPPENTPQHPSGPPPDTLTTPAIEFSLDRQDQLHGERLAMEVPNLDGGTRSVTVTRGWLDRMIAKGGLRPAQKEVTAHLISPHGDYKVPITIGRDISVQQYMQIRDPETRDLYAIGAYEAGELKVTIVSKSIWDLTRRNMEMAQSEVEGEVRRLMGDTDYLRRGT